MSLPVIDVLSFAAEWEGDNPPFLLDVREPHEYQAAKIDGSVLIPLGELPNRFAEVPKDRPVVVHCRLGGRSAKAVEYLQSQGYTDIRNLSGGIQAWSLQVDASVPQY